MAYQTIKNNKDEVIGYINKTNETDNGEFGGWITVKLFPNFKASFGTGNVTNRKIFSDEYYVQETIKLKNSWNNSETVLGGEPYGKKNLKY